MRAHPIDIQAQNKPVSGRRGFWSNHPDIETLLCLAFMLIVGVIVKLTPP
ncbi:MAG: transporter [Bradyrhizobium sp.]|jgi:hypothetical protein|uniref:Transporter n=1 Tax=Bradyrhizobium denitrificans TaxID=2734912 RepID=A0ABS5G9V9_9BRAD|nr:MULTISPECIES: hypothetical protein [Bradyrhizobium]RTM00248.1 MAG: transporter [Bradyrhizobiaceae bacterium]ABQ33002.1 hypothetical protein BBta_0737 [Bradyrhizobium sp. BTAi1]MBR1137814.1 transporter [Bradyrhizobium denitrificans]MCL8485364.1 transporter [Bradyrhizobium denitrificans]MDU0955019.1 transporter [Bradyrhizobium sp.]